MSAEEIDEAELLRRFRAMFRYGDDGKRTTAVSFAKEYGLSQSYVSDVLAGKRGLADKIANALGYERRVVFRRSEHLKEGR